MNYKRRICNCFSEIYLYGVHNMCLDRKTKVLEHKTVFSNNIRNSNDTWMSSRCVFFSLKYKNKCGFHETALKVSYWALTLHLVMVESRYCHLWNYSVVVNNSFRLTEVEVEVEVFCRRKRWIIDENHIGASFILYSSAQLSSHCELFLGASLINFLVGMNLRTFSTEIDIFQSRLLKFTYLKWNKKKKRMN